jgi:hypothetical protein
VAHRELDVSEMGSAATTAAFGAPARSRCGCRTSPGDPDALRAVARASLAFRKRTQPLALPSAGCVFQNPDPARARLPEGVPCSAGALVDLAGLKGASCGAARVSTVHANFVVNEGGATARDVALVDRMRRRHPGVSAWSGGGDRAAGSSLMAA